jgi:hypothetical protein
MMANSPIAADKVFEHAECFYQAFAALCRLSPDPREDLHAAITLAEPLIVLAAANELFLKCIICIETGKTARGHNLEELFDQLSEGSRTRIQNWWDGCYPLHARQKEAR